MYWVEVISNVQGVESVPLKSFVPLFIEIIFMSKNIYILKRSNKIFVDSCLFIIEVDRLYLHLDRRKNKVFCFKVNRD